MRGFHSTRTVHYFIRICLFGLRLYPRLCNNFLQHHHLLATAPVLSMAEDSASLVIATQRLNISDSTDDAGTRPAQVNFPLPRELRDQIYGYLLRHEHVHEDPWPQRTPRKKRKLSEKAGREDSLAHTYHFHTNILATNHTIRSEALEVLQTNNFVVVSHRWSGASYLKHEAHVPIVTENQTDVANFQHHVLRVHYEAPPSLGGGGLKPESWVMVADDLPAFCRSLQCSLVSINMSASIFTYTTSKSAREISSSASRHPLGPPTTATDVPRIKIQFRDSDVTERKLEVAKSILSPFAMVIYGLQKVSISNVAASLTTHVQRLKHTMAPRSVWVTGLAWHVLELMQDMKATADKFALAGHDEHAAKRYNDICCLHAYCPLFKLDDDEYSADLATPIAALHYLLLQASITAAFLKLKKRGASPEWRIRHVRSVGRGDLRSTQDIAEPHRVEDLPSLRCERDDHGVSLAEHPLRISNRSLRRNSCHVS